MAVVKATIKADLLTLYDECDTDDGIDKEAFADGMADVIRDAILSANVTGVLDIASAIAGPYTVTGGATTGGLT